jgi:hypothetical protein
MKALTYVAVAQFGKAATLRYLKKNLMNIRIANSKNAQVGFYAYILVVQQPQITCTTYLPATTLHRLQ